MDKLDKGKIAKLIAELHTVHYPAIIIMCFYILQYVKKYPTACFISYGRKTKSAIEIAEKAKDFISRNIGEKDLK